MNLRETILEEHSKSQTMKIVKWVGEDKKRFSELVNLFLHDEYRVVQRSAWPLGIISEKHPEFVKPYIGKFVDLLSKKNTHPAVNRNILRLLQFIVIPEKHLGKLTNSCFIILMNSGSDIAHKVFAMEVLFHITKKEPDLKRELKVVIEELIKINGAAIQSRGKKILKKLDTPTIVK